MCLDVFLAINILALEGSLPFFLDNYHPLKLYANAQERSPEPVYARKTGTENPHLGLLSLAPSALTFAGLSPF